jgi:hypothetical protein
MGASREHVRRIAAMLSSIVVACSPRADNARSAPSVTDSSGITIVANTVPRWATPSTVDTTPLFRLGPTTRGPEGAFKRVLSVVRLQTGHVVVLDAAPPFVRAFAPDGRLAWSAVARGQGPGEMQAPAGLSLIAGDSIIIDDGAGPRAVLLEPDGSLVGDLPARMTPADSGDGRILSSLARLRDGSVVGYVPQLVPAEFQGAGLFHPRMPFFLLARDGKSVVDLGKLRLGTMAQLGAPTAHMIFASYAAVAPTTEGFLYPYPDRAEVRFFDARGRMVQIVRTPGIQRRPTAAEESTGRQLIRYVMANPARAAELRDKMLVADSLPVFSRVVAGVDGRLWRERFEAAAPPAASGLARLDTGAVWDVHDERGAWLGAVQLPPGFFMTQAGPAWIAGIHRDTDDVETPRIYPLRERREP